MAEPVDTPAVVDRAAPWREHDASRAARAPERDGITSAEPANG